FVLMQLRIQLPEFLQSTIGKLAGIASPLALFVLGASINLSALGGNRRALAWMSLGRLVIVPVLALALAYAMGFRGAEFASLMIAFGSPCAVSSYTMAAQMGGDAELAAQQVMLTTVLCSLTMFIMIYLFKSMGIF
ncbi:MAG: AEC family transporter, partial [Clostridia bacterium]|nr:AEC family transporter [Clostridia bacterium]